MIIELHVKQRVNFSKRHIKNTVLSLITVDLNFLLTICLLNIYMRLINPIYFCCQSLLTIIISNNSMALKEYFVYFVNFLGYPLAKSVYACLLSRSELVSLPAWRHVGRCDWMSWIHLGK